MMAAAAACRSPRRGLLRAAGRVDSSQGRHEFGVTSRLFAQRSNNSKVTPWSAAELD